VGLLIDISSPAIATGNPTATTASFTPPDDSLLVVAFSGNDSVAFMAAPSITDSLGTHLTYTRTDWINRNDTGINGQAAIWTAPVVTGAAMTVSVTNGDGATARHCAIRVWVLTGAEPTTPVGAHGGAASASAAAIAQSYTAQGDGGQGFLVSCDWDALGADTAGTGCTLDGSATIPTNQISYAFEHRTFADDSIGGLNTLNLTLPGTSTNLSWAYIEILPMVGDDPEKDPPPFVMWRPPGEGLAPNGVWSPWLGTANEGPPDTGLRIDGSGPGAVTQTDGTVIALTTASFTPPAGSLLLILWAGNSVNGVNPSQPTITDSLGTPLTYTRSDWQSRADAPTVDGQAAAWTAPVITAAPMTVTVSNNAASGSRQAAFQVLVLTNEAASPVGAHGKAGSVSGAIITQTYTAQATLGQGFIAVSDWSATGTPKAGTDCYLANVNAAGTIPTNQLSYGFFKRTIPDDVNTVNNRLNVSLAGTSTALAWVYIEILPLVVSGPSGAGVTPQHTEIVNTIRKQANADTAVTQRAAVVATGVKNASTGTITSQHTTTQPTGLKQAQAAGATVGHTTTQPTGLKQAQAAGATVGHNVTQSTGTSAAPVIGSGSTVQRNTTAVTSFKVGVGTGRSSARATTVATGRKQAVATGATVQRSTGTGTVRKQAIATGATVQRSTDTNTVRKQGISTNTTSVHPLTLATAPTPVVGAGLTVVHQVTTATGKRSAVATSVTHPHVATTCTGKRSAIGVGRTSVYPVTRATGVHQGVGVGRVPVAVATRVLSSSTPIPADLLYATEVDRELVPSATGAALHGTDSHPTYRSTGSGAQLVARED